MYIRQLTFDEYPITSTENKKKCWASCVRAIDSKNRQLHIIYCIYMLIYMFYIFYYVYYYFIILLIISYGRGAAVASWRTRARIH